MRAVVQRVRQGKVMVGSEIVGQCRAGFVILVGIGQGDTSKEVTYLADKIINLRVFEDDNGKMNFSALDRVPRAEILVISQFTLYADTRKGRRPSFIQAAQPEIALAPSIVAIRKTFQAGITSGSPNLSLLNSAVNFISLKILWQLLPGA